MEVPPQEKMCVAQNIGKHGVNLPNLVKKNIYMSKYGPKSVLNAVNYISYFCIKEFHLPTKIYRLMRPHWEIIYKYILLN